MPGCTVLHSSCGVLVVTPSEKYTTLCHIYLIMASVDIFIYPPLPTCFQIDTQVTCTYVILSSRWTFYCIDTFPLFSCLFVTYYKRWLASNEMFTSQYLYHCSSAVFLPWICVYGGIFGCPKLQYVKSSRHLTHEYVRKSECMYMLMCPIKKCTSTLRLCSCIGVRARTVGLYTLAANGWSVRYLY